MRICPPSRKFKKQFLELTNLALGDLSTRQMQRHYLNFYGNLMKLQDRYLVRVLDTLEALGLHDDTLIIRLGSWRDGSRSWRTASEEFQLL